MNRIFIAETPAAEEKTERRAKYSVRLKVKERDATNMTQSDILLLYSL
jgi:hypothetical protein